MSLREIFRGEAEALLPWLEDGAVTDVVINGTDSAYVDRGGHWERYAAPLSAPGLRDLLERLLFPLGKRIDAQFPFVDGTVGGSARFHAALPPAVRGAPHLSFRLFRDPHRATLESFGDTAVIERRLREGANVLLAGATGSGKTTLLCRLLEKVAVHDRVLVLEEARELNLVLPHVVYLESRPRSPEGMGELSLRALLKQALRMRPERLVLGECRGEEAFELLQAMNTGHGGTVSTLHANSGRDALRRLESLAALGAPPGARGSVREWVAGAVHVVAHLKRVGDRRVVSEVLEVGGLEGEVYRITNKTLARAVG